MARETSVMYTATARYVVGYGSIAPLAVAVGRVSTIKPIGPTRIPRFVSI